MISPLNTSEYQPRTMAQPVVSPKPEMEKITVIDPKKVVEVTNKDGKNPLGQDALLNNREQEEIKKLKTIEQEVRRHEQAHKQTGGRLAGSIKYRYTSGPDGRRYVVGGSTRIDMSEVPNRPQATIDKLEQVLKAALAPANPSDEDYRVAALARQMIQDARLELQKAKREEQDREQLDHDEKEGAEDNTGPPVENKGYAHSIYRQIQAGDDPDDGQSMSLSV